MNQGTNELGAKNLDQSAGRITLKWRSAHYSKIREIFFDYIYLEGAPIYWSGKRNYHQRKNYKNNIFRIEYYIIECLNTFKIIYKDLNFKIVSKSSYFLYAVVGITGQIMVNQ